MRTALLIVLLAILALAQACAGEPTYLVGNEAVVTEIDATLQVVTFSVSPKTKYNDGKPFWGAAVGSESKIYFAPVNGRQRPAGFSDFRIGQRVLLYGRNTRWTNLTKILILSDRK
jgi:hypothetical protein